MTQTCIVTSGDAALDMSQLTDDFLEPGWVPLGLLLCLKEDGTLEAVNSEDEVGPCQGTPADIGLHSILSSSM